MNFTARLEALEAINTSRGATAPRTARERAERLYSWLWVQRFVPDGYGRVVPADDMGYWPFVPGMHGIESLLRYDALRPIVEATGDKAAAMLLSVIDRLGAPAQGGELDLYYAGDDPVPLMRLWFEPTDGADLL
jgi:hypothetical protein